jgi:hypothetical protein
VSDDIEVTPEARTYQDARRKLGNQVTKAVLAKHGVAADKLTPAALKELTDLAGTTGQGRASKKKLDYHAIYARWNKAS